MFHRCFTLFIRLSVVVGMITATACGGGGSTVPATTSQATAPQTQQAQRSALAGGIARDAILNAYQSAVMADWPLAYYQMSDSGSVLSDSSGHSLSGTYGSHVQRQAKTITTAASTAATFPGGPTYDQNGFAYTPIESSMQPQHVSLEAWIQLSAANTTQHDLPIAVYGTTAHGVRYGLYIHGLAGGNNSLMYIQHNSGHAQFVSLGGTRLIVGPIYHVVATFDGNTVTTYINGNVETRFSYPGTIDYSSVSDGFQVGGANQIPAYASASFPGTIAQVAVYGGPLSASRVVSHFLSGQLVPMITEHAAWSDAFVDSIGVNAHFDNSGTAYATQYQQVKSLLVSSGIRHVREAMSFNEPWYLNNMKDLAASGVFASYLVQENLTQAQVQQFPSLVGSSFEQFEGPNEPDIDGNPNWVAQTRSFQQNFYHWVKSDNQISRFPVLGPALTGQASSIALGNISAYEDKGNIHDYFGVFNPGTGGWGGTYPPYGVYGSISYNMNLGRLQSGTNPMMATETGYGTMSGNPLTLDYRTHLRYMTRLLFEHFNAGLVRSYPYEFLDQGGSNVFNNFGLVQTSMQPKPAYTGIKSLISAFKDPGAPYNPSSLTFQLTGFTNNVAHTTLQKRNGTYIMAIWLEVPGWVTANNQGGDIIVPNQTVTLTTASRFSSATLSTMDENGNLSTSPLGWNGQSTSISVSDKIALINLNP